MIKDLKLIEFGVKKLTIKKPKPIQKMRTNASTKNKAKPEMKELV